MSGLALPTPRQGRSRRTGRWPTTLFRPFYPLVDAMAVACAVVVQGVRPLTWRRPVRREFVRFFDLAVLQTLPTVIGAGVLVGFSLIVQALYWLERTGERELIETVLTLIVIREIAPVFAALLLLGRGGLMLMSELERIKQADVYRALDMQGVDPFLLLVLPRAMVLAIGCFCLTILFIVAAFFSGYVGASVIGVATLTLSEFVILLLYSIGSAGYLLLPVKTLLMGLAIGVIGSVTALKAADERHVAGRLLSAGFLRSMIAIFVITGLITSLGL
jgi:phospholipid/cholesterol/gamma-HCH transport system permease protein